jgi:hypothetical protein
VFFKKEVRGDFNIPGTNQPAASIFHVGDGFFWPTIGLGDLKHHIFLIFDGKQHPENIWFRGC